MQRHSFWLTSSFSQQLSFILLATALLATFSLWPDIHSTIYLPIKYGLFLVCSVLLIWQFQRVRRWQFSFSLDEYGRGLAADEQRFQLGKRYWISSWLIIFFKQQDKREIPIFLFVDMFQGDDYRHLCRLLVNRRPLPFRERD